MRMYFNLMFGWWFDVLLYRWVEVEKTWFELIWVYPINCANLYMPVRIPLNKGFRFWGR